MRQGLTYLLLFLTLTIILCSAKTEKKLFHEYQGGFFGYSSTTLKLYIDSTYYFSEWNHTGRSIKDIGKWGKTNNHYYLNSNTKTRWSGRNGKSAKFFRFEMQPFSINVDTLRLLPKDNKDLDYIKEYYTLYKVDKQNN
jgi:hypothetical protein